MFTSYLKRLFLKWLQNSNRICDVSSVKVQRRFGWISYVKILNQVQIFVILVLMPFRRDESAESIAVTFA